MKITHIDTVIILCEQDGVRLEQYEAEERARLFCSSHNVYFDTTVGTNRPIYDNHTVLSAEFCPNKTDRHEEDYWKIRIGCEKEVE